MAWRFIYEDLAEFSSDLHTIDDLPVAPVNWVQGVIVDGNALSGFNQYGLAPDGMTVLGARSGSTITMPGAKILNTRICCLRQFHKIYKRLGKWHQADDPFPGWEKDLVGWRVWHSNGVVDSTGIPESGWRQHWIDNVIDGDVQELCLYENWDVTPGDPSAQNRVYYGGHDNYYLAETVHGVVLDSTNEPALAILAKHPSAVIKTGRALPRRKFDDIQTAAFAAAVF